MALPTLACDGPWEDSVEIMPVLFVAITDQRWSLCQETRVEEQMVGSDHYHCFYIYAALARRLNTEREAASGHRASRLPWTAESAAGGRELWDRGTSHLPMVGMGARPPGRGAPRTRCPPDAVPPGRGARRQLSSVFSQPETHKEPSGSPSPSLSYSLSFSLSRSPFLSVSLCKLNWYYYCDGQYC